MRKRWAILLLMVLTSVVVLMGCRHKELTKEEAYKKFQEDILKISEYTCKAEVKVKGNKSPQSYTILHTYKRPNNYKLEILSPKSLKGKVMEYKGDKIFIKYPDIKDVVELPNVGKNEQYMFIGDFIKNYLQNESIDISVSKGYLRMETDIPGENKNFNKQVLYIDQKTNEPHKMEILSEENEAKFIVTYSDFRYKK